MLEGVINTPRNWALWANWIKSLKVRHVKVHSSHHRLRAIMVLICRGPFLCRKAEFLYPFGSGMAHLPPCWGGEGGGKSKQTLDSIWKAFLKCFMFHLLNCSLSGLPEFMSKSSNSIFFFRERKVHILRERKVMAALVIFIQMTRKVVPNTNSWDWHGKRMCL